MNFKKVFFIFGALGMLLSSCNKIADVENPDESTGRPCVITATFDATRTSIDDNWNTAWEENDEMTVYVTRKPSSSSNIYGCSQFTYKGNGEFSGTVDSKFDSPYNWFAVYPSIKLSSSTSSKVSAEIEHPANQTMTGDTKTHIAGTNDPIFGYALDIQDNPKIRMHHIASVIDFNITNGSDKAIKVTKIEFTAPEKIAGKFTAEVDLKNSKVETPEWKAADDAVKTVTLSVTDGVEIAKDGTGHFYAAIHPISAEGDYTIKVTATSEGKTYVTQNTVNTNLTFNAGKYRTLNYTFTPGQPEPDQKCYVKVTSAPQDWSGTYLIVDESAKMAFDENASSYASKVTISDGKVLWDETVAKCQVIISPSSVSGMYDVKTVSGKYMYSYDYGETTLNSSNKDNRSRTYYNSLSVSGGNVTMYSTRGSDGSVNYFGYVSKTSENPNNKNFGYKEDATTRKVQLYKLNEGSPEPPTPVTEKTYELVSTLSEGTYIICGYETDSGKAGTWGCLFPPVANGGTSIQTSNYCTHIQLATTAGVTRFTTTNAELIASEVELVKSGNNWLIKLKSDGKYMYYNSSAKKIDFTTSTSSAAHTMTSGNDKRFTVKCGSSQEFYHSGTDKGFGYAANKGAGNIQFYKLKGETPVEKKEQPLSFSKDTYNVTAAVGTVVEANTLSGASTTVTYTSSKESVATVAADGKLTIKGEGTATITATAAEDDTHKPATKSYTLNVTLPTPSSEKTYELVSTLSEGTYIICGYESDSGKAGTWGCLFPPVEKSLSSIKTSNYCDHIQLAQTAGVASFTTDNANVIASEVELVGSGSNWSIKLKSSGQYMYYNSSAKKIDFANSTSSAAHTITVNSTSNKRFAVTFGSGNQAQEFYHSGTDKGFGYRPDKSTGNIQFYKLQGSSPTPTPTPSSSMNIENSKLAAYLDAVKKNPYFTNNTFGSYSSSYTSSLMQSGSYYSGSSASNRLDQPAPVVLTWTGNATKVEVFTSSSKTTDSRVASLTFTSSSSADIYNLIPGQKYYYTASNGSTTVATGEFTPEGRRRMMKVSSNFGDSYANNCRDLGGLPTVDGKYVKYGLIYRGTNIDNINNDSNAKDVFLKTMGIKWDIDLRASGEKSSAPTLDGVSKGTQSYSASFDDDNLKSKTKMAKTVKEIIDAINNEEGPEPVYIHCRIGSDRTGYVCLLIEALIGVTQNYCDTDYEITSFAGSVTGTRFRVDNTWGGGMYRSGIEYFADFEGTTLHDKVYNFVTSTFDDGGLNISKTDVDQFISKMTE